MKIRTSTVDWMDQVKDRRKRSVYSRHEAGRRYHQGPGWWSQPGLWSQAEGGLWKLTQGGGNAGFLNQAQAFGLRLGGLTRGISRHLGFRKINLALHQKWKKEAQWRVENSSNDNSDDERWLTVNGETLNPGGNAKYVGNQLKLEDTFVCGVSWCVFRRMVTITINERHQFFGIVLKQSF